MSEHEDDAVRSAVQKERVRCMRLADALADIHERNADTLRDAGTYRTIFGSRRVKPRHENIAQGIMVTVHALRTIAHCISAGYDVENIKGNRDVEKIDL